MSNYAVSVLATGQAKVAAKFQIPEQRRKMPTVMELALKNQTFSIPNAQDLRVSPLRPVEINYFTNVSAGSATAKVAAHTGSYGDSGKVSVTYVQHVETFSLPRKLADNSIYAYQELFNNLYEMKWKNLRTRHDTSALAFLYANRCQLTNAVIQPATAQAGAGTWADATKALEIAASDRARFVQKAKAFMASRYFTGQYDVVADLQIASDIEYQMNQGQGNAVNTSFQYGNVNIATTQDAVDSAYPNGAVLMLPQGLFAGLCWNEALNRRGVDAGQNSVGSLGTISDPFGGGGIADISMYTNRSDTSANTTGGSTQDIVDQWELTLTIGYVAPPLSTNNDSVIHEIGQA